MRILLDNCVPRRLADHIQGHEVANVVDLGWADLKNGTLLEAMARNFDALVTVDSSMPFQQRLDDRPFALVVMRAKSNRFTDLLPLVPALLDALAEVKPGEVREISFR
jgi:predicted nuclease of predicted toxin-antitoxin system